MKANLHDAGNDLFCGEEITLEPLEVKDIIFYPHVFLKPGFYGLIVPRSSYHRKGLMIQSIYDAGYEPDDGYYSVVAINASKKPITLKKGDRFAQLIIQPIAYMPTDVKHPYKRKNKNDNTPEVATGILELKKVFRVRTGHKLTLLHDGHKCLNPHGEYYTITLTLRSYESATRSPNHMLIDFGELDKIFKEEVYDFLDHAFLIWKDDPDVEMYKKLGSKVRILDYSPTVEYLAEFIYNKLIDRIPDLAAVEVVESMDNAATWKVGI